MSQLAAEYSCDNLYQLAIKLAFEWGLITTVFSPLPDNFLESLEEIEKQKQNSLKELQVRFQGK